jgi:2-aminobenzoate-CoA ligase
VDTFTRDHLPPAGQWPDLILDRTEFHYPPHLNAAVELTDRMVDKGFGDHVALIGNGRRRTYKELADWTSRLACLVEDFGVKPEPGPPPLRDNPAMVAAWLAVMKAGAVAVNTMPLLRRSRSQDRQQAEIAALCDSIVDRLVCPRRGTGFSGVVCFDGTSNHAPGSTASLSTSGIALRCDRHRRDDYARCWGSLLGQPVNRRPCIFTATC